MRGRVRRRRGRAVADRVLPLALAGLAALGHRGAFAADGESSDGAGVVAPARAVACWPSSPAARPAADRPGVVMLFLPRAGRRAARRARSSRTSLADGGPAGPRWRRVPFDPARSARRRPRRGPAVAQAIVARPAETRPSVPTRRSSAGSSSPAGGWSPRRGRPAVDRRARPSRRRRAGRVVYKGLVAGGRLAELYPDLRRRFDVGYAIFHQRYATNTHAGLAARPAVPLDRPQRRDQHGPRQSRAGPRPSRATVGARPIAAELLDAGPLLSPDGSDSLSLDEGLELLTATGWDLAPALLAAIPEALGAAARAAPARGDAAPPDRRDAGAVGRAGGDRLRRRSAGRRAGRPQRASTGGLRRDARPAGRGRVGGGRGAVRRRPRPSDAGGSGRASCCSSSRAGARSSRTPRRRRAPSATSRSTTRRGRSTRTRSTPRPPRSRVANRSTTPLRYLAGLDAEKARLDIKTMALEAHEPLWSMGDDTPTPGRGRLDRPVADHLRQAFAQVTNPAIDPERERVVMDLRVELGRRPALLGGPPRGPRTLRLERPIVADLDALVDALLERRSTPAGARCDVVGVGGRGAGSGRRSTAWRREAVAAERGRRRAAPAERCARSRSIACRSRRSSPPAPSTPR